MANSKYTQREKKDLQPHTLLWSMYAPDAAPYAFDASTPAAAGRWRRKVRKALNGTVGFQDIEPVDPSPKTLETVDRGDFVREKVLIRTTPHTVMPVYLLKPKSPQGPLPVVLAFHGHGYGAKDIVGLWENGDERHTPDGYHKDFAIALCRQGFAVAAPEISCFGERHDDFSYLNGPIGGPRPTTCQHVAAIATHLGGSAIGLRVLDAKRLVDYLATRDDVDIDRLGAMGISGGGLHTFYSAALDERIRACVISGYFSTYRDSILAMAHCPCNFVHGMGQFGEMGDIMGLIAPRPALIEAGTRDPIFPVAAVKKGVRKARETYKMLGAEDELETDYFEGRHQISGARAYEFLWEKLSGRHAGDTRAL